MKEQINVQMSLNPNNPSHKDLLEWIESSTTNRSSFIRETMLMRMMGMFRMRSEKVEVKPVHEPKIDVNEVLRLIQV